MGCAGQRKGTWPSSTGQSGCEHATHVHDCFKPDLAFTCSGADEHTLSLSHALQPQGCLLRCGVSLQLGGSGWGTRKHVHRAQEGRARQTAPPLSSACCSRRQGAWGGKAGGNRKSRVGWVQASPGAAAGPSLACEDSLRGLRPSGLRADRAGHESQLTV